MNFQQLTREHVDRMLQYMVQVCVRMNTAPFRDLTHYADTFYDFAGAPAEGRWEKGFDAPQRAWVDAARQAVSK